MRREEPRESLTPAEGEDFYLEGAYVVFTARYHLRRGYCCRSGCRHCPYGYTARRDEKDEEQVDRDEEQVD